MRGTHDVKETPIVDVLSLSEQGNICICIKGYIEKVHFNMKWLLKAAMEKYPSALDASSG